jgi:hypothetical protein
MKILLQSQTGDGYDVIVQQSDGSTRTLHFATCPKDVQKSVDAATADWKIVDPNDPLVIAQAKKTAELDAAADAVRSKYQTAKDAVAKATTVKDVEAVVSPVTVAATAEVK